MSAARANHKAAHQHEQGDHAKPPFEEAAVGWDQLVILPQIPSDDVIHVDLGVIVLVRSLRREAA